MVQRLPSLTALRAFEAAGRHLSFTRAAQELNVTQAAISHQIKGLEEHLGVQLFRRLPGRLLLTDAGQIYLPDVREAFDRLATATGRLRSIDTGGVLTVHTTPSFAASWLVPRLAEFRRRHPEIDVRLAASDTMPDLDREDIDLSVTYGDGRVSGMQADLVLTEEFAPMLSPGLLALIDKPLNDPNDLRHFTLLHDHLVSAEWADWLKAAGATLVNPFRGPAFTHSNMVLQAAVQGQGVALGRSVLAADDLVQGRLIRPFKLSLPSQQAYYVVYPRRRVGNPRIDAFRSWLVDAAAALEKAAASSGPVDAGTERYTTWL